MRHHVEVLRPNYDCTNGGVSSRHDRMILVVDEEDVPSEINGTPTLVLVRRVIAGQPYMHVKPVSAGSSHTMMGGNFVYSCDSRFRELAQYPLPIHDRIEG